MLLNRGDLEEEGTSELGSKNEQEIARQTDGVLGACMSRDPKADHERGAGGVSDKGPRGWRVGVREPD